MPDLSESPPLEQKRLSSPLGQGPIRLLQTLKRRQYVARQRLKAWLRERGVPGCASPQAAAFEDFKRRRSQLCPADLSDLAVPAESGLVSVVLPVYNGQDYLTEAIQSVLSQSGPGFELIIVNDGSTDRTGEIVAGYAQDPRVTLITQTNQKLPQALSNGFRLARGEFLTWISADNRFKPGFLEQMVACLRRHPAVDMVYANQDIIGEDGRPLRESEWFWPCQRPLGSEHIHWPGDVAELNVIPNNYVGAAFMYRQRARYLLGQYSPNRFGLEDYDYWMRMNALLTLRHADFDEPVYDYRLHRQSLTSREKDLMIDRNRERLLAFDAFRREQSLRPMTWCIECAHDAPADSPAEPLRRALLAAGHPIIDRSDILRPDRTEPPFVQVRVVNDPRIAAPPAPVKVNALTALIACCEGPLPDQMPREWDVCIAWSRNARPVRLPIDRQGWLLTSHLPTLLSALDIRARSDHFARMEQKSAVAMDKPQVGALDPSQRRPESR